MTKQSAFPKYRELNGVRYFKNIAGFYDCKLGVFNDYQELLEAVIEHNEKCKQEQSKTKTIITSVATAPKFFKWDDKFIKVGEDTFVEVSSFGVEYENGTFKKRAYSINSFGILSLHNYVHEWVNEITEEEFNAEIKNAYENILNTK